MTRLSPPIAPQTWTKGAYFVSTDSSLIPLQTLNDWFASDDLYWAKPLPLDILKQSLENCLCFGLYYAPDQPSNASARPEFIGIARCITDYTTFLYITDVYVHCSHQGNGLGSWIVECIGEVIDAMPYLRRSMLFTMDWERSVPFYKRILGMSVQESYTGRFASEYAKSVGMDVVLAGRAESKVKELAFSHNLPYRVFDLTSPQLVRSGLDGIRVLLNCAGPFTRTAGPLINACIKLRIHYLDISAELVSYQLAEK
ncbi:uncharacterized protein CDV56_101937 [Aspergillus thermomutatus]|uniref:N-acetyltransferase domain-containing protein n=1 Tax=Aspergillus thermomutatus TaxID=41047 RepID=A0A397HER5_ASPTH|nr:uncharacterized protein CDV56_101937 [Aspergillus thermomutatus]RHZ59783.1 hypothetical protein CDV56_101937 [Aspergillus thermomutatus]